MSAALAPTFEKVIGKLAEKTGNRGTAFGLLMLAIATITVSCYEKTLLAHPAESSMTVCAAKRP